MSGEEDQDIQKVVEKRVVEHIVRLENDKGEGGKSPEELKDELETRNSQLEALALKELENTKGELSEQFPDFNEEIENIGSPSELESLKSVLEKVSHKVSTKVPTGKLRSAKPQEKEVSEIRNKDWVSHEEMIDFLVSRKEIGELESRKQKNQNHQIITEGKEAERMIDELWKNAYLGDHKTSILNRKLVYQEDLSDRDNYVKDIRTRRILR